MKLSPLLKSRIYIFSFKFSPMLLSKTTSRKKAYYLQFNFPETNKILSQIGAWLKFIGLFSGFTILLGSKPCIVLFLFFLYHFGYRKKSVSKAYKFYFEISFNFKHLSQFSSPNERLSVHYLVLKILPRLLTSPWLEDILPKEVFFLEKLIQDFEKSQKRNLLDFV